MPKVSKGTAELKKEISLACIELFNEKGLKFTMEDVAKHCRISKKTLYFIYDDKEALFLAMVDYVFDKVKESENRVLKDDTLPTLEKIRKLLGVLPEGYAEIDFSQMYSLKEKFPIIYDQVEKRLETGWETSIQLIEQGQKEGVIRKDINVALVKVMFESTLEQFFQRDVLIRNKISYNKALRDVVEILVDGIKAE